MAANSDSIVQHSPQPVAPFDPGDVVTTDRLEAYMDEGKPMLNNYARHAKIGGGQHGEVYLCYKINTRVPPGDPDRRVPVAMKSVKRDNARAKQMKRLRQQRLPTTEHTPLADKLGTTEAKIRKEIAIMKKCRHPHVVRLFEIIDDRMKEKIYMVMEYLAGGEVKWRNEHDQPILSVEQTRRIIRDAILGLEYLHHQGIIHRDIKPANLLWTEDRRQVKIADFGVSHFSYAQRLAAAGDGAIIEDPEDPILLDDSDLTRRAGTPSFLAPEVVYEHTNEPLASSLSDVPTARSSGIPSIATSQSLTTPSKRPPITKAIDIWALGVTLYCLLFGRTPFVADPAAAGSEWSLYNSICNHGWAVDNVMGADHIPTGGRRPVGDSEGAVVIRLLDHLLQKDVKNRITLEKLKCNKWFLRDLSDPKKWLQLTLPKGKIDVTYGEEQEAMSTVHFRWHWGVVSRRISSLFRRSREANQEGQDARGPVRSDPNVRIRRHRSAALADRRRPDTSDLNIYGSKNDKGKHHAESDPSSEPSSSSGTRPKSIERWPVSSIGGSIAHRGPSPTPKGYHGSPSILIDDRTRPSNTTSAAGSSSASGNVSPQSSPTTTDKPRARFAMFLNTISQWRPNKFSSPQSGSSPSDSAGPSSSTDVTQRTRTISIKAHARTNRPTRRSEEALRYYQRTSTTPRVGSGPLTADRRASSWGQGDQPMEFAEVLSECSSNELNDREMIVGSGGVCNDRSFAPRTPSRLSNVATASPASEPDSGDDDEVEQRFGPSCFDEDSSTIASAFDGGGGWQDGRDLDEDEDDDDGHHHDGDNVNGDLMFEDDDEEEDDSGDPDDDAVTFSPRKRPPPTHD
ncbi:Serine/threonine-protein kinase ssp1 [Hypsizygus marmoreus]|uniref:Serine/threonine-protein kinase ssp1 n=1 Tax=Hypsizygus marmoreus TaxID=39966 RepID=A0A369KBH9_HYPMA|nr:Serine/threonine-protein kinase ssp1 [Hypsizygus marmoreus]